MATSKKQSTAPVRQRPAPVPAPAPAVPRKPARRPAAAAPAAASKPPKDAGKDAAKGARPSMKLVRDSFTLPEVDYALIDTLKLSALGAGRAAKKSELIRAGLRALSGFDAKTLVAALDRLEPVKTGRPKKG